MFAYMDSKQPDNLRKSLFFINLISHLKSPVNLRETLDYFLAYVSKRQLLLVSCLFNVEANIYCHIYVKILSFHMKNLLSFSRIAVYTDKKRVPL